MGRQPPGRGSSPRRATPPRPPIASPSSRRTTPSSESDLLRHERGLAELAAVGAAAEKERADAAERLQARLQRVAERRIVDAEAAAEDARTRAREAAEASEEMARELERARDARDAAMRDAADARLEAERERRRANANAHAHASTETLGHDLSRAALETARAETEKAVAAAAAASERARRAETEAMNSRAEADVARADLRERTADASASEAVAAAAVADLEAERKRSAEAAEREEKARRELRKLRAAWERAAASGDSIEALAARVIDVEEDNARLSKRAADSVARAEAAEEARVAAEVIAAAHEHRRRSALDRLRCAKEKEKEREGGSLPSTPSFTWDSSRGSPGGAPSSPSQKLPGGVRHAESPNDAAAAAAVAASVSSSYDLTVTGPGSEESEVHETLLALEAAHLCEMDEVLRRERATENALTKAREETASIQLDLERAIRGETTALRERDEAAEEVNVLYRALAMLEERDAKATDAARAALDALNAAENGAMRVFGTAAAALDVARRACDVVDGWAGSNLSLDAVEEEVDKMWGVSRRVVGAAWARGRCEIGTLREEAMSLGDDLRRAKLAAQNVSAVDGDLAEAEARAARERVAASEARAEAAEARAEARKAEAASKSLGAEMEAARYESRTMVTRLMKQEQRIADLEERLRLDRRPITTLEDNDSAKTDDVDSPQEKTITVAEPHLSSVSRSPSLTPTPSPPRPSLLASPSSSSIVTTPASHSSKAPKEPRRRTGGVAVKSPVAAYFRGEESAVKFVSTPPLRPPASQSSVKVSSSSKTVIDEDTAPLASGHDEAEGELKPSVRLKRGYHPVKGIRRPAAKALDFSGSEDDPTVSTNDAVGDGGWRRRPAGTVAQLLRGAGF